MSSNQTETSKRDFLISELHKMNVFVSQQGENIADLDCEELNYELVLASFREIDTKIEGNRWF